MNLRKISIPIIVLSLPLVGASMAAACEIKKTAPKSAKEIILPKGENLKIDNRSLLVRAQGNNIICGSGSGIKIILAQKSSAYTISLSGGNHTLEGSVAVGNLRYSSSGKSRILLTGGSLSNTGNKISLKTGPHKDIIQTSLSYREMDIYSGAGDDKILAQQSNRRAKTVITSTSGNNNIQVGLAGAPGHLQITSGSGADTIAIKNPGNKLGSIRVSSGAGSDRVVSEAASDNNNFLLSDPRRRAAKTDRDVFTGGPGRDVVADFTGQGNVIRGGEGDDRLLSGGSAQSFLYGEIGNDTLLSQASGASRDELYGGRNNDVLRGDRSSSTGASSGVVLDAGSGDDYVFGSRGDDVIFYRAGIKHISAKGGNDYILRTTVGRGIIKGGGGRDTLSYILHSYNSPYSKDACLRDGKTGVVVDLFRKTEANSFSSYRYEDIADKGCRTRALDTISGIDSVVGSPDNDRLFVPRGKVQGVYGKDVFVADKDSYRKKRSALIANFSYGSTKKSRCIIGKYRDGKIKNAREISCAKPKLPRSPDKILESKNVFAGSIDGWPIILGGKSDDEVELKQTESGYLLSAGEAQMIFASAAKKPICKNRGGVVLCPGLRKKAVFYTGDGSDRVVIQNSVSRNLTSIIHTGTGDDVVLGGPGQDFVTSSAGKNKISTRDGDDHIVMMGSGWAAGGAGDDVFNIRQNPCYAGSLRGGADNDLVVFVGGKSGVLVDYGLRPASRRYSHREVLGAKADQGWGIAYPLGEISQTGFDLPGQACPGSFLPLEIAPDIEALEGTSMSDLFIGSPTNSLRILTRQGGSLGDIVWSRGNSRSDLVTVSGASGGADLLQTDESDTVKYCFGSAAPPGHKESPECKQRHIQKPNKK